MPDGTQALCISNAYQPLSLSLTLLQTKLKSAVQLQDLLDATRILVPRTRCKMFFILTPETN